MAHVRDPNGKGKENFLTGEVSATKWGLQAQQRVLEEPAFQRLTNAFYTSTRELGTFQQQTA